MKNIVLKYGLIAGLIVSSFMAASMIYCYKDSQYSGSMVVGFGSMIIAFSMVFIGVKKYRDNINNGSVTFWKAFLIGVYIALIGSSMYVLTWLVVYYGYMPDFMEVYCSHILNEAKASGISEAEYNAKVIETAEWKEAYKNPVVVVLMTYMEILPVGLVVALVSAGILKKKSVA